MSNILNIIRGANMNWQASKFIDIFNIVAKLGDFIRCIEYDKRGEVISRSFNKVSVKNNFLMERYDVELECITITISSTDNLSLFVKEINGTLLAIEFKLLNNNNAAQLKIFTDIQKFNIKNVDRHIKLSYNEDLSETVLVF